MAKPAQIKTNETAASVTDFIKTIEDEQKQADCNTIIKMMEKASGEKAKMWGASMVGFGNVRYKSPASGREVDWFIIGFSPRKANISLHLVTSMETLAPELEKLGKYKAGKGCLYINRLADIDKKVLEKMIATSLKK